jgi:hypothetical protein
LNEQGVDESAALEAAHEVERNALGGELAVLFQGVSIGFLAQWVQEHEDELNCKPQPLDAHLLRRLSPQLAIHNLFVSLHNLCLSLVLLVSAHLLTLRRCGSIADLSTDAVVERVIKAASTYSGRESI